MTDAQILDLIARYRTAFEGVLGALTAGGRPEVLTLAAADGSTERLGEAALAPVEPPTTAAAPAPSGAVVGDGHTLTHRATLNVVGSLLDYGAKLAVGIVVVPILVSGLGRAMYGVWEMLGRLVGYMTAGDGRPTQALRLVVSNLQGNPDDSAKRRYVGGALVVWLLFMPLVVVIGGALVWLAPVITKTAPALAAGVRLTAALLTVSLVFGNLASLPESVLRGMNLGYKRMGLQAGLEVVGGALMAGAIYLGLGMLGAAGAQVAFAILMGLCFWWVVRKYVPWFGVERPTRADLKGLLSLSLWYSAGEAITKLQLASDVLILGMVLSPTAVTAYALTSYAARTAVNLQSLAAGGVIPGIGGVIGERQFEKAVQLRNELLALTWLFATTVGATILLWNRSFLTLWVGGVNYAGPWVNLLIVAIMAQTAFVRSDAYVIDAALQPRMRVMVTAVAATLTVVLATLLTMRFGTIGLCLGIIAGRLTQSVAYPHLVRRCFGDTSRADLWAIGRPLVVMALLFAAAARFGDRILAHHWIVWAGGVVATAAVVFAVALVTGLPAQARVAVLRRGRELARRLR
jgi:O-antigen/teichoic acid export membrane protein